MIDLTLNELMTGYADNTDVTDTIDEPTTEATSNEEKEQVAELLSQIRDKFDNIKQVKDFYSPVQELLSLTNHESWSEFTKQYSSLLVHYWQAELPIEPLYNKRLETVSKQLNAVKEKIKTAEVTLQKMVTATTQLSSVIQEQQIIAGEGEIMSAWDTSALTRSQEANQKLKLLQPKLKTLTVQKEKLETELAPLYQAEKRCTGRLRAAEKASTSTSLVVVNTGSMKDDAWILNRIADSVAYKVATLEVRQQKVLQRNQNERFHDPLMDDASGGAYTKTSETLIDIGNDITNFYAILADCEVGYEAASNAANAEETGWFPEWTEWNQRLQKARLSLYNGALKRSTQDKAALAALAKRS